MHSAIYDDDVIKGVFASAMKKDHLIAFIYMALGLALQRFCPRPTESSFCGSGECFFYV